MENYIEIVFNHINQEQSDMLVALLSDFEYEGFEENENELRAFILQKVYNDTIIKNIAAVYNISYTVNEIEHKNWNKLWESNFSPVVVDDFVAIRAEFHLPISFVTHEIIITPKMSFGTGHHATTKMMMQQMSEVNFIQKSVFDFGTGTGILAILAEKLGAQQVIAVDNDDWSIKNAKENIQKNNCAHVKIEKCGTASRREKFDIILANIIKNVILDNMDYLIAQLKNGGTLILSGLLPEDENDILDCAKNRSLNVVKKTESDNWISLRFFY